MEDARIGEELHARRFRCIDDVTMLLRTPSDLARRDQKHLVGARKRRRHGGGILVVGRAKLDTPMRQVLRCGCIANNADHMGRRCDLQEVGDDKPTQLSRCPGYDDSFRNCHVPSPGLESRSGPK
jgi:hypothetical protein